MWSFWGIGMGGFVVVVVKGGERVRVGSLRENVRAEECEGERRVRYDSGCEREVNLQRAGPGGCESMVSVMSTASVVLCVERKYLFCEETRSMMVRSFVEKTSRTSTQICLRRVLMYPPTVMIWCKSQLETNHPMGFGFLCPFTSTRHYVLVHG